MRTAQRYIGGYANDLKLVSNVRKEKKLLVSLDETQLANKVLYFC